jgi:catechol 2,3-dioxygenase-like lactoylglutathione lyase family enzyme
VHAIGAPMKGELREPTGPHVSWYVADLDEAVDQLGARGIEMRVLGEGRERIVWVADPAGNTVEFQQDPEF